MKYLKFLLLVSLVWSAFSQAQTIKDVFPYTVQSHSEDGTISMNSHAKITGVGNTNNPGEVNFNNQGQQKISDNTCYGQQCIIPVNFNKTSTVNFASVREKIGITIKEGGGVTVDNKENYGLEEKTIHIINGDLDIKNGGTFGDKTNGSLVFVNGDVDIEGQFYGYLYSTGTVLVQTPGQNLCGAVSSKHLDMKGNAVISGCSYNFDWFGEEDKEEITLQANDTVGYVFGEDENAAKIIIESTDVSTDKQKIFKVNYGDGYIFYKEVGKTGDYIELKNNSDITLPLNKPLYIKYDLAGPLNLTLTPQIAGQTAPSLNANLNFVPYKIEVQSVSGCPVYPGSFKYEAHSSCPVLAKAGEESKVEPSFITYGFFNTEATKQSSKLLGYTFDREDALKINGSVRSSGGMSNFTQVGLITASVTAYCALDNGGCGNKLTKGSSAIVGRTVPDSLFIQGVPGVITDGIAYRGKPNGFMINPEFIVNGCAVGQAGTLCDLPSYSGEFAKGLMLNKNLQLSVVNDSDNELTIDNLDAGKVDLDKSDFIDTPGTHTIELTDELKLLFAKVKAVPAQKIQQELKLNISITEDAISSNPSKPLSGSTKVKLADNAWLRFGYLHLADIELPINTDGHITGKLYYFDSGKHAVLDEDHFSFAGDVANNATITATAIKPHDATPPTLAIDNDGLEIDGISVAEYPQAATFDVALEVLKWLQPYNGARLALPTANLRFMLEMRMRANDRVFNRRAAVR
ncbi:DUF6701 domain-containing protein [Oceanisphaera sp. IT1-181]|uniref:DUF6701 domain-containing protein n=1 Tax=Oceanisphaera sp. IT1-181 TaxID=3081199 RepID=UPI0029C9B2CE|nr:DUF6701 domain-containing protein [Oceanisphaera sp. IT1-181]